MTSRASLSKTAATAAVVFAAVALQASVLAQCSGRARPCRSSEAKTVEKPQTTCPIMGGKVNKKLFADVEGYRVYVCCRGCIEAVKKAPQKSLAAIRANGETPERLPKKGRVGCTETKGTAACSRKNAATCGGCGKVKGSPGCCK